MSSLKLVFSNIKDISVTLEVSHCDILTCHVFPAGSMYVFVHVVLSLHASTASFSSCLFCGLNDGLKYASSSHSPSSLSSAVQSPPHTPIASNTLPAQSHSPASIPG